MQCPKCHSRLREDSCISLSSYMESESKQLPVRGMSCMICGYWSDTIPEPTIAEIPPASGAGRRTFDGLSVMEHVAKHKEEIAAMYPKSSWQVIKSTLRLPGKPATINRAFTRLMCAK